MSKALNYNEQKVVAGKAELLLGANFIKHTDHLSFYDKINHFERLTSLNEAALTNTVHVSLSFHPTEQLSNEKVIDIANTYMQGIGFSNQPYLVYRHHDAVHPHIHIVSTNIQWGGSRISTHNLGRNQSEKTRKEIELSFGLVKADSKALPYSYPLTPVDAQKVIYGRSEIRRAIANVLQTIINQYNYSSLEQLNAVLKLYNVIANKGEPGSRLFDKNGLQYQVLDDQGNKVGVPIKASSFHLQPTLVSLQKRFEENEKSRNVLKKRTKTTLDWILQKPTLNLETFIRAVEKEKITVVLRQNKTGLVYGITFVDHKAKAVFNGSELGKGYSAQSILALCTTEQSKAPIINDKKPSAVPPAIQESKVGKTLLGNDDRKGIAAILLEPELQAAFTINPPKKKRKKRRKMNL